MDPFRNIWIPEMSAVPHLRFGLRSLLTLARIVFCLSVVLSEVALPADDEFESVFDGETLEGWNALDMSYRSVRDGAITGESTAENPCTSNQFMVWQGGNVADFELKLKFRVTGNNQNSGVQFRSVLRPDGLAVGYQADILHSGGYLGGVCDEIHTRDGPELLSANGKKTVIDADGNRTATDLEGQVTMRPEGEWNDYHIIARGHPSRVIWHSVGAFGHGDQGLYSRDGRSRTAARIQGLFYELV